MILRAMLQRLYAALTTGPGLNARPHHSRQRIDVTELRHLQAGDPALMLSRLLAPQGHTAEFAVSPGSFRRPNYPESEWSDEQRAAGTAQDRQEKILEKLRDITEDATDYYHDHGEHALFLGFPLLSLPPVIDRNGVRTNRIVAPVMLAPIHLRVRRGANPGVAIELAGERGELIQPNPALLAWIEQQTGATTENIFTEDEGEDPWREIAEAVALVSRAAGLKAPFEFTAATPLEPVARTENLSTPALLPSAVLGLYPLVNPGLLRDTQWMIEQEAGLANPVKAFLSTDALAEPDPASPEAPPEFNHADAAFRAKPQFSNQLLVTHADPCQAEAVAYARQSAALVVHGPPGTGKSQTIANIIGDHLARGERVLFVCDKRTALDVVKYRLESMGLDELCGVIHDPQSDRRPFYLRLRERLESLAEARAVPDPARSLASVNERLQLLHEELRGYFDCLHGTNGLQPSFHQLCGEWFDLKSQGGIELPEIEGVRRELIGRHRADVEEILRRALEARWPESPFRGRLRMTLSAWMGTSAASVKAALETVVRAAARVDEYHSAELLALHPVLPLSEQAAARRQLALRLNAAVARGLWDLAVRIGQDVQWQRWRNELTTLASEQERLSRPLDRELYLHVREKLPSLADCSRRLLALQQWQGIRTSWKRLLAFKAKRAATEAVESLALPLNPENEQRATEFYAGLKTRHLWSDLRDRLSGATSSGPAADDVLISLRDGLPELLAVREAAELPANAAPRASAIGAMANLGADGPVLAANLQLSAARADAIAQLEMELGATNLFTSAAVAQMSAEWRGNGTAQPLCARFLEFVATLEPAIRLNDRLRTLPSPLQKAVDEAAGRGLPWEEAEPALRASALAREIRDLLQENEALARVDTRRVEAAFSEFGERTAEKTGLVRRRILHLWQNRWRERLLSTTGSRLNTTGAGLRQRLFVRGQKAMKLRQMIGAGADTKGGDPLFDLCPVWMASPATVAQIFPRETLFDVIVFDEASQCRLEEALPVLLRGKRVVIAGDPRQLPPTRFFEQALAETDVVTAETTEEVFQQQQSEAEDLLSAALNLNVQEAFLDVHYRSRHEGLIGFSNQAFYGGRLQPIPGHPRTRTQQAPIRLMRVNGPYRERGNVAEAKAAADLVAELLDDKSPASIGVACFNLNQRDLILDALEERAAEDKAFAKRLETARKRQGRDSFEGLFVKNLENVQGDERDHMIICTTFGPDASGKFHRNFGALSRAGGERRLNVLVTRARSMVHVLTSIPRSEYMGTEALADGQRPTGRHQLYAYLRYAEALQQAHDPHQQGLGTTGAGATTPTDATAATSITPSVLAESLGRALFKTHRVGSTLYWGNEGFCVDLALTHPVLPTDVTIGVLADFTRYARTPDPIAWEQFRSAILAQQGWKLHRVWSPALFREPAAAVENLRAAHLRAAEAGAMVEPSSKKAG